MTCGYEGSRSIADGTVRLVGGTADFVYPTGLAPVGDLDGDGVGDIAIGNASGDLGGDNVGDVRLWFGPVTKGSHTLAEADATIAGTAAADQLGWAIAGDADLDGDGYDDVVIGEYYGETGDHEGRVSLLYGPLAGGTTATDDADAWFDGEEP